jgi:hypothetical protein
MTETDLETLRATKGSVVEIETKGGEHLLIKVISLFDQEADPDVFFWDVTSAPTKPDAEQGQGYSLPLSEIVSVRVQI